ncbi:MAG: GyrI-like domain-containing protein [Huintestinicola sp.]
MPPVDLKKKHKDFFRPTIEPMVIEMPSVNYAAVSGEGELNEHSETYSRAMTLLYSILYTIKICGKTCGIKDYYEFTVPPAEFLTAEVGGTIRWTAMIMLPEYVDRNTFEWACSTAASKKKIDTSAAEMITLTEGKCVQIVHIGTRDKLSETIRKIDAYLADSYHVADLSSERRQHEIFLSDPKRTSPDRRKIIIRQPIKSSQ